MFSGFYCVATWRRLRHQTRWLNHLQLLYADGRVISADVETESFEWTHISDAGVSTVKTIRLSDIRELVLAETPAAKQVAEIRQMIEQLDSPEYRLREEAEEKLSNPEFFGSLFRFDSKIMLTIRDWKCGFD